MNDFDYDEKEILKNNLIWCFIFIAILSIFCWLAGCSPAKHVYKITFGNGDVEYYELDYKPKKEAKTIEYEGESILGVKSIERID